MSKRIREIISTAEADLESQTSVSENVRLYSC